MLIPPMPPDELQRLRTLRGLNILDTPNEERFDNIAKLAQRVFEVPIALISLVDANRLWLKACFGLDTHEVPREISFCAHTILQARPLVIEDALLDPRFSDNPLVIGEPYLRFYAGQPLIAPNGSKLGTLCLFDYVPRTLNSQDLETLKNLGKWAEKELFDLEQHQTLEMVRDSETKVRAVLNNAPDGIVIINSEGLVDSFNPAAEKLFGYQAAEIVGASFKILFEKSYYQENQAYIERVLSRPNVVFKAQEALAQTKDGRIFPVELSLNEMWLGSERFFTVICRDISERKRLEQLKNEFIAVASHELRTPLTSIRGALGLLLDGDAGEMPPEAMQMLNIAHRNSERLTLLVNDIIDSERIESGKLSFNFLPVDLISLVKQALEVNRPYAKQFNVELIFEAETTDCHIKGDADRLMQVLTNLLSNAIKFSPSGGKVVVTVAQAGQKLRVAVRDEGPGIPEDFRSKVFEKFAQADGSKTRQHPGSGLGLSISKSIIEKHQGNIAFETEPAKGTTFYFDLPAAG